MAQLQVALRTEPDRVRIEIVGDPSDSHGKRQLVVDVKVHDALSTQWVATTPAVPSGPTRWDAHLSLDAVPEGAVAEVSIRQECGTGIPSIPMHFAPPTTSIGPWGTGEGAAAALRRVLEAREQRYAVALGESPTQQPQNPSTAR
jgi:hypothetical protein